MDQKNLKQLTRLLSVTLFVVYFWFGIQKFFPNVSPAEEIAFETIHKLTFGMMGKWWALNLLAIWEIGVAFLILFCSCNKFILFAVALHLIFTFTPFLFFPSLTLGEATGSLTLLGQYIVKNLVLLVAVYTLYLIGKEKKMLEL